MDCFSKSLNGLHTVKTELQWSSRVKEGRRSGTLMLAVLIMLTDSRG